MGMKSLPLTTLAVSDFTSLQIRLIIALIMDTATKNQDMYCKPPFA
jgi:hypothetical protein